MRRLQRTALLPYPPGDVYDVVSDVESYPEFLDWCKDATIVEASATEVTANLVISARNRIETLVTRNTLTAGREIVLELVSGPFRHFSGCWTFAPVGDGCRVNLWLEFEIANSVVSVMIQPFLGRIADRLVDAFSNRARAVLGS
ncbi:MAG: type II toxin-antitoxin system RatA family toxin [Gammaproteobacteria bacterium]|nr:type II toxin-antitoxin system RatA family toxin [Gammaproteobacteria bacterium]